MSIPGTFSICAGQNATLTATGTGIQSYLWSTGGTGPSITVSPSATTVYSVTVTCAGGVTATASATVTVRTPTLSTAITHVLCNGNSTGAIDLTVTGGVGPFNYDWSNVGGTNNPQDQTNLAANTYTVTVTAAGGCTVTTTATVTQPPLDGTQPDDHRYHLWPTQRGY